MSSLTLTGGDRALQADFDSVVMDVGSCWEEFRNATIFITGGTGFFGCWLMESLLWANEQLGLNARAIVLTRSTRRFATTAPHLACSSSVDLVEGDVRSFAFPNRRCSHIIHAAAETYHGEQASSFDISVQGTRRVLDFAVQSGAEKFLFVSSGGVYPSNSSFQECDCLDLDDAINLYGKGKLTAELLCKEASDGHQFQLKIARCFSFIGPHSSLNAPFAVSAFLENALSGNPIQVLCSSPTFRSYMYAADLATWLWVILAQGENRRAYNVGSAERTSIVGLAEEIAAVAGVGIEIIGKGVASLAPRNYVPDTRRARTELGLTERFTLREAVRRTFAWHLANSRQKLS